MVKYRVIFKWTGRPLKGYSVSGIMPYLLAKEYYERLKENGLNPELLEIKE